MTLSKDGIPTERCGGPNAEDTGQEEQNGSKLGHGINSSYANGQWPKAGLETVTIEGKERV